MNKMLVICGISAAIVSLLMGACTKDADDSGTEDVVFITYGYEKLWLLKNESVKLIVYEKIELIKAGRYEELKQDLQERTGIPNIRRIEIGKIDFLKDSCFLNIYYEETGAEINLTDQAGQRCSGGDDDD